MIKYLLPRGIRNNNPGNLRLSKTAWQGQRPVQADKDFVEFETALSGLRALMRVLLTYHVKYQLDTVESIINRFAPPHENDTGAYIIAVVRRMKVNRFTKLDLFDEKLLARLACAIVLQENGAPPKDAPDHWYPPDTYLAAAKLAMKN